MTEIPIIDRDGNPIGHITLDQEYLDAMANMAYNTQSGFNLNVALRCKEGKVEIVNFMISNKSLTVPLNIM